MSKVGAKGLAVTLAIAAVGLANVASAAAVGVTPTVTSVSPNHGSMVVGTTVTITGTNFTLAREVKFGSANASKFTVNSESSITAESPPGAAGTVDVTVTAPVGTSLTTSATSPADHFTYEPPTVTSVAPNTGPLVGGTPVTISGVSLTGATAVKFGAANAASFSLNSDSSITAVSPGGTGPVDVTVITPHGTTAISPADQFTYEPPIVSEVSTCAGPTSGETTVTITGAYFKDITAVKVGSANALSFTVNSETSITAVLPPGTGTLDVTVSTPGATSATSPADEFTYEPPATGGTAAVGSGKNSTGQLGAGYWTSLSLNEGVEERPVSVVGLTNIEAVAAADGASYALLGDGTVWSWGGNTHGQLGYGSREDVEAAAPGQVRGLCGVKAISAAGSHALALLSNGRVMAWGHGDYGELGDGTSGSAFVPQLVHGPNNVGVLEHVVAIASGGATNFALLENGTLMAWGKNEYGMLGIGVWTGPEYCAGELGTKYCGTFPRPVLATWPSGVTVTAVSAGYYAAYALLSNGAVMAWGHNGSGQLGTGPSNQNDYEYPVQVLNVSGAVAVSGGYKHALALLKTGEVMGWGEDPWGAIGGTGSEKCNQGEPCERTPRRVSGLENVSAISAGHTYSLALSAGTVYAFGANGWGQLGLGFGTTVPTAIPGLGPVGAISAGWDHSLAVLQSGSGPAPLMTVVPEVGSLRIVWTFSASNEFILRWQIASEPAQKKVHLEGWSCSPAYPCSYVIPNLTAGRPYEVELKGEKLSGTTKIVETDRKLYATPLG